MTAINITTLPPLPDAHALAVLLLVLLALFLFTRESIAIETSSLFILAMLSIGFTVFPYVNSQGQHLEALQFFSGFGHEALVAVCALMIAGNGLVRTGALVPLGRILARLWLVSPALSMLLTLLVGAFLSAFVNNVPIVVLLLPILISVSLRTGEPASGMLMPMGFATLVGGMSTSIGTSTNLLVVSVAADMGLRRLQMFDFFVPAAIVAAIAIVYLWLIAPRLLPARKAILSDTSPRIFTAQLVILEDGFAVGKTLTELIEKSSGLLEVSRIMRGTGTYVVPLPDAQIQAGDRLMVNDTPENLKELESALDAMLYVGDTPVDEEHPLSGEGQQIAEIVVMQGSPLLGMTLRQLNFYDRYQLMVLAIHREGNSVETLREKIAQARLRIGDVLLVQGDQDTIGEIKRAGELLVLDATADLPYTDKAVTALLIMAAIILVSAFGDVPIAISAVGGVLLMLVTRCLTWRHASMALSTQVILIVAASLAMGSALLKTGGAEYLAQVFVALTAGASPAVIVSGLMLLMAIMTNIVSNNAAAVIGTPIAISIAQQLQVNPEPFVIAVLFGANMSYATPMAYKTNLLVMHAGGYKFTDFVRVGVPLTIIVWLSLSLLLPVMYSLSW
ncbi:MULTISPECIES: SLC13 family permease [Shewanella]|uniref:TrkA-C domain protein n=1 Tax=Shewanella frigidimarina (strain NCIMB 400) TaxID=318167 RepID=Q089B2_SHEFN|nr:MULTISPECIES: SLC13 family permease [Shewanella]ABI70153.1 TrkA-C domain protein [Shewanella frigidimarina NCIMB 400]